MILTDQGELYASGFNNFGQLGVPDVPYSKSYIIIDKTKELSINGIKKI